MSTYVTPTEVRLSYENLLVSRVQNEGDEPTFSTMVLVDKDDTETVEGIKAAIKEALDHGIANKWKGKRPTGLKNPLRDGDIDRPDDPNAKGKWFFNAKGPVGGKEAPFLYAKNGRQVTANDPDAGSVIYSGVYGRISLNFYAYDVSGNRGVAAGVVAFLSSEHGERLDSRPTVDSALAGFGIDPLAAKAAVASEPSASTAATTTVDDGEDDPWGN